jgi:tRNA1Val (adenine37-N6)-methyltransferase
VPLTSQDSAHGAEHLAPRDPRWLEQRRVELEAEFGEAITVDGLTGKWSIFQRRRGHRHSVDDVLTAWYAVENSAPVDHFLDLGTGIGTVGMMVLSCLAPTALLSCIEAQAISHRLLLENIRANGLEERVAPLLGDLRELNSGDRFLLVTGSPPYFAPSAGIVSADSQRAHARFELRGDVRDYARAAIRHLSVGGTFVFCFPYAQKSRAVKAVRDEGFSIVKQRDVVPKAGLVPLFSVFACRLGAHDEDEEEPFVVRDEAGRPTQALDAVRARFGWELSR